MLNVFSTKIKKMKTINEYHDVLSLHSPRIRQHLSTCSQSKKILNTLTGELIVRQIISNQLGYDPNTIIISLNPDGKPYCPIQKYFHFNISHSGEWVVCAFANEPVGIDIQKIVHIPRKRMDMIVLRFFHKNEQIQYFNLKEKERESFFFTQWSIKESYVKFKGKGFQIPLQSFFAFLDQNGRGSLSDGNFILYFQQYDIDSNYKLVACSLKSSFSFPIKKISIPSITKQ